MKCFRLALCVLGFQLLTQLSFAQTEQPAKAPAQLAPRTVPNQVQLFIPYKQYSQEDNQRILKLYEPLRVSDVSDGMNAVGLQDIGIVDESIRPLWKDTENFTYRIVDIAVTARYVPINKRLAKTTDKDERGLPTLLAQLNESNSFFQAFYVLPSIDRKARFSIGAGDPWLKSRLPSRSTL